MTRPCSAGPACGAPVAEAPAPLASAWPASEGSALGAAPVVGAVDGAQAITARARHAATPIVRTGAGSQQVLGRGTEPAPRRPHAYGTGPPVPGDGGLLPARAHGAARRGRAVPPRRRVRAGALHRH